MDANLKRVETLVLNANGLRWLDLFRQLRGSRAAQLDGSIAEELVALGMCSRGPDGFGVTIFGGTTQFLIAWLIDVTKNPMVPAWYQIAANLMGLVGVLLLTEHADVVRERPVAVPRAG